MILVTGGHGFIGRHVCSVLSAHNKNVVALDRKDPNRSSGEMTYPSVKCDVSNKDQVKRILRQHSFTTIVHLASLLNTASQQAPLHATSINIGGSMNILEGAKEFRIPKVIYSSSISVYGSKPDRRNREVSETESAAPQDIYGAAKRYVEILGDAYCQQFGIQFVALRISTVIGPGAVHTSSRWRSEIFEKLGLPNETQVWIPYKEDQAVPFVHVDDVADMIERLVDWGQCSFSVYNTPSETWILKEMAKYIESLDKKIRITFGESDVSGIPGAINGQRFATEFGYALTSVRERFRRQAQLRREPTGL